MQYYETNLDGLGYVSSEVELNKNDYMMVEDDIYPEPELYKVKTVGIESVNVKRMNTLEAEVVTDEEKYKLNKLFSAKVTDNLLYFPRVQKGQVILVEGSFYEVGDVDKNGDEAKTLHLEPLPIVHTKSVFRVYRRNKETSMEELFKKCTSWGEGIREISRNRSKRDDYYYYFK